MWHFKSYLPIYLTNFVWDTYICYIYIPTIHACSLSFVLLLHIYTYKGGKKEVWIPNTHIHPSKLHYSHGVAKKSCIIRTHTRTHTQLCVYIYLYTHTYVYLYTVTYKHTQTHTHQILTCGCAHRNTIGKKIPFWTVMLRSS